MFVLGHVGITAVVVKSFTKKPVDYRKVALFSILPDLVDKPIGLFFADQLGNNTRLIGHTLLIGLLVLAWGAFRRYTNRIIYSFSYLFHFLLDRIWRPHDLPIFLFPLLGMPTPMSDSAFVRWRVAIFTGYTMWGEIVGLVCIVYFVTSARLYKNKQLSKFLHSGEIDSVSGDSDLSGTGEPRKL